MNKLYKNDLVPVFHSVVGDFFVQKLTSFGSCSGFQHVSLLNFVHSD